MIYLPLHIVASEGSVKQALTTSKSDLSDVHVPASHLLASKRGNVATPL